eukprot:m.185893 g.185893  ORF g.185893 m.185893 type:complete len:359 (-) comp15404_c2_seq8:658-1734(-)
MQGERALLPAPSRAVRGPGLPRVGLSRGSLALALAHVRGKRHEKTGHPQRTPDPQAAHACPGPGLCPSHHRGVCRAPRGRDSTRVACPRRARLACRGCANAHRRGLSRNHGLHDRPTCLPLASTHARPHRRGRWHGPGPDPCLGSPAPVHGHTHARGRGRGHARDRGRGHAHRRRPRWHPGPAEEVATDASPRAHPPARPLGLGTHGPARQTPLHARPRRGTVARRHQETARRVHPHAQRRLTTVNPQHHVNALLHAPERTHDHDQGRDHVRGRAVHHHDVGTDRTTSTLHLNETRLDCANPRKRTTKEERLVMKPLTYIAITPAECGADGRRRPSLAPFCRTQPLLMLSRTLRLQRP